MGIKITGFSTPVGGVSWKYTQTEKKGIEELFFFLEARRILINPIEMEIKYWCEQSALEIKHKLTELLSKYDFSEQTIMCFRSMVGACNDFLDRLNNVKNTGIIYKNQNGDWDDITFSSAMKQFRAVFRDNTDKLSSVYKIPFLKEIPKQY
ncbi:MAG: DUF6650 family protein [Erysipelotrichaceae bacterium]